MSRTRIKAAVQTKMVRVAVDEDSVMTVADRKNLKYRMAALVVSVAEALKIGYSLCRIRLAAT